VNAVLGVYVTDGIITKSSFLGGRTGVEYQAALFSNANGLFLEKPVLDAFTKYKYPWSLIQIEDQFSGLFVSMSMSWLTISCERSRAFDFIFH
jgi:hypothetical protein